MMIRRQAQKLRLRLRPAANLERPRVEILDRNRYLHEKNVLITGAGRNIGRSIATEMALQGANVYFTDTDADQLSALEDELGKMDIKSAAFDCDSSSAEQLDAMCDTLSTSGVAIDVLVHNASSQIEEPAVSSLTQADWRQTFETNLFGPMHLTQRIARDMREGSRPGSILFITSIHQWINLGWTSYSTSKAALGMAIKELAAELAPDGIRVNGIAPGWVGVDERGEAFPSRYSLLGETSIPPDYIGRSAAFLSADFFSGYTTGAVLTVDAGMSLCTFHVTRGRS